MRVINSFTLPFLILVEITRTFVIGVVKLKFAIIVQSNSLFMKFQQYVLLPVLFVNGAKEFLNSLKQ